MKNLGLCSACGAETFVTKRVKISKTDLIGCVTVSGFLIFILYFFFPSGKGGVYFLLGFVVLIGWIFSYFIEKKKFKVEVCKACHLMTETEIMDNSSGHQI